MALRKLKQILSTKWASILIVLFAITGRLIQIIYFFNIRVDASYQTIATKNFVNGHGITLDTVLPSDLSTTLYTPLIKWPPGFSLLLAPFYNLSGQNYIVAGILLHSVCAIALILFTRSLLHLLEVPKFLINIQTLVTGVFIYSFYFIISSDAIAASFFVAAIYYTLSFLKSGYHPLGKVIAINICLLACSFIKYLMIPVVFVLPFYLIVKGYFTNEKRMKKAGVISLSILIIGISTLLIYQKYVSGSATYISQSRHGFFPQNLFDIYPFFPACFINPDTFTLLSHKPSNLIFRIYQLIFIVSVIPAFFVFISFFKTRSQKNSLPVTYLHLLLFASLSLITLLITLSLFVAKEVPITGHYWTYVQEARYYGVLVVLMQLLVFIFYTTKTSGFKTIKFLSYALLLLLLIETVRGINFDINRLRFYNKEEYSWQYEDRFQKYADSVLKRAEKKFSVDKAVVIGSAYYANNRVCLYSHIPVLLDGSNINRLSSLKTKKPVLLLIVIWERDFKNFQSFLSSQTEIAGKFNDIYFYTLYVKPY